MVWTPCYLVRICSCLLLVACNRRHCVLQIRLCHLPIVFSTLRKRQTAGCCSFWHMLHCFYVTSATVVSSDTLLQMFSFSCYIISVTQELRGCSLRQEEEGYTMILLGTSLCIWFTLHWLQKKGQCCCLCIISLVVTPAHLFMVLGSRKFFRLCIGMLTRLQSLQILVRSLRLPRPQRLQQFFLLFFGGPAHH